MMYVTSLNNAFNKYAGVPVAEYYTCNIQKNANGKYIVYGECNKPLYISDLHKVANNDLIVRDGSSTYHITYIHLDNINDNVDGMYISRMCAVDGDTATVFILAYNDVIKKLARWDIVATLQDMEDSELINVINEYATINQYEMEYVYYMNEFNEYFQDKTPENIAMIQREKQFDIMDSYFNIDGYGYPRSFNNIYDEYNHTIYDIADYIIDNNTPLNNIDIASVLNYYYDL